MKEQEDTEDEPHFCDECDRCRPRMVDQRTQEPLANTDPIQVACDFAFRRFTTFEQRRAYILVIRDGLRDEDLVSEARFVQRLITESITTGSVERRFIDKPTKDLEETCLPMYIIYDRPTDFPDVAVVRRQWSGRSIIYIEKELLFQLETVEGVREQLLSEYPELTLLDSVDPDPHIAEVWL